MNRKQLYGSLVGYAVLALIGTAVLKGPFLMVMWIFFGGLAVKSWVAYKKEQMEEAERLEGLGGPAETEEEPDEKG
jgi:hypothetical protein